MGDPWLQDVTAVCSKWCTKMSFLQVKPKIPGVGNCSNRQSLSREKRIDLLQVPQRRNCQIPAAAHMHGGIKPQNHEGRKDLRNDWIQLLTMTHLSFVTSHHHLKGGIRARDCHKSNVCQSWEKRGWIWICSFCCHSLGSAQLSLCTAIALQSQAGNPFLRVSAGQKSRALFVSSLPLSCEALQSLVLCSSLLPLP